MGPRKAKLLWACQEKEAKEIIQAYLARWPALNQFRRWIIEKGSLDRQLVNDFGRVRYFPVEKMAPEMLNFHPQTGVSDMLVRTVPALDAALPAGWEQVLWTHDSIDCNGPTETIHAAKDAMVKVAMREWSPWLPGFEVGADIKIGKWLRPHPKEKPIEEWDGKDLIDFADWEKTR